jgi:putative endonuclease
LTIPGLKTTDADMNDHRRRGLRWERTAESFLQRKGLKTLERNFRCTMGEIDLVMTDGPTLVFTEVKYRRRNSHGSGAESVGPKKQRRIIRAASRFLQCYDHHPSTCCRFDVVSIDESRGELSLNWIRNAFSA